MSSSVSIMYPCVFSTIPKDHHHIIFFVSKETHISFYSLCFLPIFYALMLSIFLSPYFFSILSNLLMVWCVVATLETLGWLIFNLVCLYWAWPCRMSDLVKLNNFAILKDIYISITKWIILWSKYILIRNGYGIFHISLLEMGKGENTVNWAAIMSDCYL